MKLPNYILAFLVFIPFLLPAQNEWGYSVASLKVLADDGRSIEIVFVSKVKQLSALGCNGRNVERSDTVAESRDEEYTRCICEWFYVRLGEINPTLLSLINKDGMYGDVELYNNPSAKLKDRLSNPGAQMPTIFLSKRDAEKKRTDWLALAKTNRNFVVEIE